MTFLTGIKKNLNRAGQSIMQKSDRTIDEEFEQEYDRWQRLEQQVEKLTKEAKGYQNSLRALVAAQSRIADTMELFFEHDPPSCFQHYHQAIQHIDTNIKSNVDEEYATTVMKPLARYCAYFIDINEAVKRRQKKLLDYDTHRIKVRKLVEKPSDDPDRLSMAEKEANLARDMYENINTILIQDLPHLVNLRIPTLDPSFEASIKTQWQVGQIGYNQLESIRSVFPQEDHQLQQPLDSILQQMRDLTICSLSS